MTDRDLMQQALEALELCNGAETAEGVVIYTDQEVAALRERLAQPEQELVDLSYQPDWKEEYQKAVDLHCLTLDELREKNVEIKRLKAMIESQDMVLVRSAARIVDLQTHIENFDGGDR